MKNAKSLPNARRKMGITSPHSPTTSPQLLNTALPYIMHIDLNSCFAIIEQQANRLLRGRPVGVAAYDTPRGFVVAASYEAKAKGIKLGVNVEESRAMAPGIVVMTPDPAKYREAHRLFKKLMLEYTPDVTPKSIDEFVLDMRSSPALRRKILDIRSKLAANPKISNLKSKISDSEQLVHNQAMEEIGYEIKRKIRERLGEWVTVNIGIATNRFLAKYAAGFGKPDGMTLIDHTNLRSKYEGMKVVDLPGINTRYRARLRIAGIYTPIDFLEADLNTLKKQVFKSIVGYYWYLRLRGHEIDDYETTRKRIGHQHAVKEKVTDMAMLERLLMKLCEKTGRRLRNNDYFAGGVHVYVGFEQSSRQLGQEQKTEDPYMQNYLEDYDNDATKHRSNRARNSEHVHAGFNLSQFRSWHHGEKVHHRLYNTPDIYLAAKKLLHGAVADPNYGASGEFHVRVKIMAVHVYDLKPWEPVQTNIFEQNGDWGLRIGESPHRSYDVTKRVSDSVDAINDRYGEFVVTPALMMEMQGTILDRIAFGNVRDM